MSEPICSNEMLEDAKRAISQAKQRRDTRAPSGQPTQKPTHRNTAKNSRTKS